MGAPALEVWERDLGGGWVEACYFGPPGSIVLAVEPGLDPERRRLWELVAHGLALGDFEGRFVCLSSRAPAHVEPRVLDALELVLWAMEPGWVRAVEEARRLADCPRVVAAFAGVPLEAALALCYPPSRPSRAS